MIIILIIIIFGLAFSYFATVNTAAISINFGFYTLSSVPVYLVILASIAIGVFVAAGFYLIKSLSDSLTIGEEKDKLKKAREERNELVKKSHKLELENTKLKAQLGKDTFDDDSI